MQRDDLTWPDWLALRARAHGQGPDAVQRLARSLDDWPDTLRLVASDPEQTEDPWWLEGAGPSSQPWLSLVRSLWVPLDELLALPEDSAWSREGLPAVSRLVLDRLPEHDLLARCRARLPALTTLDLTRLVLPAPGLADWLARLPAIERLDLGEAAAGRGTMDALVAAHAPSLHGLELRGARLGKRGLASLAGFPSHGPLHTLGLAETALDLAMFEHVETPWLHALHALDLARAANTARHVRWLRAPQLRTLSLEGVSLRGRTQHLLRDSSLPALRTLRLPSTGITTADLEAWLASHPQLTCLDLRNNALPDAAVPCLARDDAPELDGLLLGGNHLSQGALAHLCQAKGMREVRPGVLEARAT